MSSAPHAFLMPVPTHGHVTPLLQLAQRLASNGFFVTFVTLERIISRLLPPPDQNHCVNPYPNIQFLPVSVDDDLAVEVLEFEWLITVLEAMKPGVKLLITQLQKEEPPVTCFIADSAVLWAQQVADEVGVPGVAFWPMSAMFHSLVYFWQPLVIPCLPIPGEPVVSEELIPCIPGVPPLLRWVDVVPADTPPSKITTMFQFMSMISASIRTANAVIIHSVYELESSAVDALRQELPIYTVGPLLPLDSKSLNPRPFDEDDACLQWLDTRDPSSVLYVSFGTSGSWSEAELTELALGLEASEQPFMWVTRPTLVAGESSFSISNIFSAETKHRSMIVSWAPQLSVLQHPSVGGVLTHCGWNSTIESLYMGVPIIGWPKVVDQPANERFVSHLWKIGISLETPKEGRTVRRGAIEKAVRGLFNGEEGKEARSRIAELKKIVRAAAGDGGSSKKNLDDFLKDMTKRAHQATD